MSDQTIATDAVAEAPADPTRWVREMLENTLNTTEAVAAALDSGQSEAFANTGLMAFTDRDGTRYELTIMAYPAAG